MFFTIDYIDMTLTVFVHLFLDNNYKEEEMWLLLDGAYKQIKEDRKSTYLIMINLHQI